MDQSSEQSGDQSMDRDDGRWLTYPELAAVRGIDKPSAIRLATRKKWRRQRDNHRVVRVLVPSEWLSPRYQSMDRPIEQSRDRVTGRSMEQRDWDMDQSSNRTDFAAALAAIEAAHAGEVAALHGQIAGLKSAVDTATASLAEANAGRAQAEERASRAVELVANLEADGRTKDLQLAEAEQAARIALGTVEALRQAVEARKARGRLRRAWDGWRGR
jgi:chromosome segregation ATPase